jgi:hypothetical protein
MTFFEYTMLALITFSFLTVSLTLGVNFIVDAYVNYVATMVQLEDLIADAKQAQNKEEHEENPPY